MSLGHRNTVGLEFLHRRSDLNIPVVERMSDIPPKSDKADKESWEPGGVITVVLEGPA